MRAPQQRVSVPREIWILVCAALLIALGFGLVAPVLPQYALSFDVGVAAASAIVTVFALTRLSFAPVTGPLMARFGERRTYVLGLTITAVSSLLCGFAGSYTELMIWRGLGGIGSVTFTVASMGLMVRLSPPEARGRMSALYGSAFVLGNICGPLLGSVLSGFGFRVPFFIYAAMLFCALTVVLVFLRGIDGGRDLDRDAEGSPGRPGDPGRLGSRSRRAVDDRPQYTFGEAIADPVYRGLLATGFANGWSNWGVRISLVPLLAAATPSLGVAMAGPALTVYAIGTAVAQQFSGRFVDAVGRRPVMMTGLLLSGVSTLVFGWATALPVFLALSGLAGVAAALIQPAMQAMAADLIGADRNGGSALSGYSMAGDLGAITGTLGAGIVAQTLGFGWAFFATGLVLILATLPWLRLRGIAT